MTSIRRHLSNLLSAIVIACAMLVLVGWYLRSPELVQIMPGLAPMQFNTALCFLMLGAACLIGRSRELRYFALCSLGLCLAFSTVALVEHLLGSNIGIDSIFVEPFTVDRTRYPGRMSIATASAFVLSSLSLWGILRVKSSTENVIWIALCIATLSLSSATLVEYIADFSTSLGQGMLVGMALHTTLCHFLLGISIISFSSLGLIEDSGGRRIFVFSAPLFVGVILSVFTWKAVLSIYQEIQIKSFQYDSEIRATLISNQFQAAENTLLAVKQFYLGSAFVSSDEFETFVDPLVSEKESLMAIDWAPRVRPSERAKFELALKSGSNKYFQQLDRSREVTKRTEDKIYFPIQYTHPEIQGRKAYGFDHYSDELRAKAMDRAARTGETIATQPFLLFRSPGDEIQHTDLLLTLAIVDNPMQGEVKDANDPRVRGFVIGVLRASDLITKLFRDLEDIGINMYLLHSADGKPPTLSVEALSMHSVDENGNAGKQPSLYFDVPLSIGGTSWILRFNPTTYYLKSHFTSVPSIILVLLLFCTFLFSSYLFLLKKAKEKAIEGQEYIAKVNAALKEREEWFAQLSRASPVGIFRTDAEGACLYVNESWSRLTGLEQSEAVGDGWASAIHPEDREAVARKWQETAAHGEPFKHTFRFLRPNGEVSWTVASSKPVFDSNRRLVGHVGTNFDLTEQKKIQEQLTKVSAVQRAIIENAGYSIISTDTTGTIQTFNTAAETMLGYRAAEVVGIITPEKFHVEAEVVEKAHVLSERLGSSITPGFEVFVKSAETGEEAVSEWTYVRKDGSRFPVLLCVTPIRNEDGAVTGYLGIAVDITERMRLRRELEENEARLRLTTEGAGIGTWDVDLFTERVEVSKEFSSLLEYPEEEAPTTFREVRKLISPEDLPKVAKAFEDAFQGDGDIEIEHRMLAEDGRSIWVLWLGRVVSWGKDGAPHRIVGIQLDISKIKAIQAELDDARRAAETANETKAAFLANMSHEIRTPLTAVIGYAEQLLDKALCETEREEFTHTIVQSSEHLLELVNDILDFSKLEAGMVKISKDDCSVFELVRLVESGFVQKAKQKGIGLEVDYQLPLPESIYTDSLRIRQVLLNLVGNAIKFTEEGRVVIRVGYDSDKNELSIAVDDSGIGLTAEQIPKLFKDFSQADESTTKKFGGTGLGLSITKKFVDMLGGRVSVESTYGKGSVFTVNIPAGKKALKTMTTDIPLEFVHKKGTVLPEGLDGRVLVVEDTKVNQKLFTRMLEKTGLTVELAENGKIGLEKAQTGEFELVLMDMQMPVMDGYTATEALRNMKYTVPIVGCTADASTAGRTRCLKAGCDEVLVKPFSPQQLAGIIKRYL